MALLTMTSAEVKHQQPLAISYGLYESRYGQCLIATTDQGICNLHFPETNGDVAIAAEFLQAEWGNQIELSHTPDMIQRLGDRIFLSTIPKLDIFDLHLKGTPFQIKVWRALMQIPFGETTTYKELATAIAQPTATRAVGNAVGKNPVSYVVPCHRVIRTSGALGGYRWGLERKTAMLNWEQQQANALAV